MQSWILVFALAALTLDAALSLPVTTKESEEITASDDQLIQMLDTNSLETDSENLDYIRKRRATDKDESDSSPEDATKEDKSKDKKDSKGHSSESSSSEEKTKKSSRRRRSNPEEDVSLEQLESAQNEIDVVDYVQGCEVHEENSEEVNNETFIE